MRKALITLKDNKTGKEVSFYDNAPSCLETDFFSEREVFEFMWEEGNESCDCNRADYFDIGEDVPCYEDEWKGERFSLISMGEFIECQE